MSAVRTRGARAWALVALLALGLPPAGAQPKTPELADLSLNSLLDMPVTGASRFVQRRSQAASAVTVITREEIAAFGHRTLADVLRSVRGTAITTDRTYQYLGVRGFLASGDYNTRVLLLVDGRRANDALYDQAMLGNEFGVDLDMVERVEFIPGQGSAVYGGNALFGVVNVITRESPRTRQATLHASAGSAGLREARARLDWPWAGGGLQLQLSQLRRDGDDLFDPLQAASGVNDGWTHGTDHTRRRALWVRADAGDTTFSLSTMRRRQGTPMTVDLVWNDPRNVYEDRATLVNIEHPWQLGPDNRVVLRAFAGRYAFAGDYVIDYPPVTVNRDDAAASWHGLEARWHHTGLPGHRLVMGAELQNVPKLWQQNVDLDPFPAPYLDDRRSSWRASGYAEDQWSLGPGVELHTGGRADRVAGQGWQFSPRLALVANASDAWVLKLIHGRAWRPPNAFEAFYEVDAAAGYRRNPGLQSERVAGTELVAEWRGSTAWRASASVFQNRADALLQLMYDATAERYAFANLGELVSRGVEAELEFARDGLRWRANVSHVTTRGSAAGLSLHPHTTAKATALLPLPRDWTLALEGLAQSRRGAAPGHGLLHATVRGPVFEGGPRVLLQLRNALDREVWDPGYDPVRQPRIPLPRRELRIELEWALPW